MYSPEFGEEQRRLAALRGFAILDTEPEASFDRIIRIAARHFKVPAACISLFDETRSWFKASRGLKISELSRKASFGQYITSSDDVLFVPDAREDSRFADLPSVARPRGVRFFAGAPMIDSQGNRIGALCLIDIEPRDEFSKSNERMLQDLAAMAMSEIELRQMSGTALAEVVNRINAADFAESVQKRAEEELRLYQAELELIIHGVPMRIFLKDDRNRIIRLNKAAADALETTVQEAEGRYLHDIIPPDAAQRCHDLDLAALQSGKPLIGSIEEHPQRKGRPIWARTDLVPYVDPETGMRFVLVATFDITSEIEAEREAQRRQQQHELMLDTIPQMVLYKDDQNRIIRLNKTAAEILGRPIEEIEGRDTNDLLEADEAKRIHDLDIAVLESGEPQYGAIEKSEDADGKVMWLRTDRVPYIDPVTGQRFLFYASANVTAEIEAIQALEESEERYRSLYENAPVMMHSLDEKLHILSVSDYWLEKLGYTQDEVIGRSTLEFVDPDSARRITEDFLPEFRKTGYFRDVEFQFLTKSGDVMDVLATVVGERDEKGNMTQATAVLIDITENKKVQQQLLQAQKMETVGQLTGGLAHDFNNLLGVIIGNLELVEREFDGDERANRRLKSAALAAEKGAELTHRLLAFSRRQALSTEPVEINPVIDGFSDMLRRTLGEATALHCRLGADIPVIRTDVSQLESAILNLAVNARDAMPAGGELTIETGVCEIDEIEAARQGGMVPGSYVTIAVADTGYGMTADQCQKAFEPFFTTKEVGKGSGLGLSMVYGFVSQSGGHVRIDSVMGAGTCVRLFLPVEKDLSQKARQEDARADAELGGSETVLVVEDQDEVRKMAAGQLEELGYSVVEAANGLEGRDVLASDTEIDLLFTDIVMPGGMDGKDLAAEARRLRPELPVLFTTGYAESEILREGDISVAENLLAKPYRRAGLAKMVRRALDGRGAAEARVG